MHSYCQLPGNEMSECLLGSAQWTFLHLTSYALLTFEEPLQDVSSLCSGCTQTWWDSVRMVLKIWFLGGTGSVFLKSYFSQSRKSYLLSFRFFIVQLIEENVHRRVHSKNDTCSYKSTRVQVAEGNAHEYRWLNRPPQWSSGQSCRWFDSTDCGLVARVPGYRSSGPGSISDATWFSEK
jgi:hypothetical protein